MLAKTSWQLVRVHVEKGQKKSAGCCAVGRDCRDTDTLLLGAVVPVAEASAVSGLLAGAAVRPS